MHNLSSSTKKYRPGTLVLVKQTFFFFSLLPIRLKVVTEKIVQANDCEI